MSLYDDIMKYARQVILFADEVIPIYICSIGAHIANIHQHHTPFFYCHGIPEKLSVNVVSIAPPGFAKTYAMKFFVDKRYGICPIKSGFRGKITEAGFVGTMIEGDFKPGDASDFKEGILCFNEMSNILIASESTHSGELLNQVLEALSEGLVTKRLASGLIEIETNVTIWGGSQPFRSDMRAGLGRRMDYVAKNWTKNDIDQLKRWRNSDKTKSYDKQEVMNLKNRIQQVRNHFNIEEVVFNPKFYDLLLQNSDNHLVLQSLEHIFIGKECLSNYDETTLKIPYNGQNKALLKYILKNRKNVALGGELAILVTTISSMREELNVDGPTNSMLWEHFRGFGYSFSNFSELLKNAMNVGAIGSFTAVKNTPYFKQGVRLYRVKGGLT